MDGRDMMTGKGKEERNASFHIHDHFFPLPHKHEAYEWPGRSRWPPFEQLGFSSQGTDIFNDSPIPSVPIRPSSKRTNHESMIDDSPLRTFLWEVGTKFSFWCSLAGFSVALPLSGPTAPTGPNTITTGSNTDSRGKGSISQGDSKTHHRTHPFCLILDPPPKLPVLFCVSRYQQYPKICPQIGRYMVCCSS